MTDRRDDTSVALVEIRAVRSRAASARILLAGRDGLMETRRIPGGMDDDGYYAPYTEHFRDPDADEIDALLKEFIDKTVKFARRGIERSHRRSS
jgi:hypothetical protein